MNSSSSAASGTNFDFGFLPTPFPPDTPLGMDNGMGIFDFQSGTLPFTPLPSDDSDRPLQEEDFIPQENTTQQENDIIDQGPANMSIDQPSAPNTMYDQQSTTTTTSSSSSSSMSSDSFSITRNWVSGTGDADFKENITAFINSMPSVLVQQMQSQRNNHGRRDESCHVVSSVLDHGKEVLVGQSGGFGLCTDIPNITPEQQNLCRLYLRIAGFMHGVHDANSFLEQNPQSFGLEVADVPFVHALLQHHGFVREYTQRHGKSLGHIKGSLRIAFQALPQSTFTFETFCRMLVNLYVASASTIGRVQRLKGIYRTHVIGNQSIEFETFQWLETLKQALVSVQQNRPVQPQQPAQSRVQRQTPALTQATQQTQPIQSRAPQQMPAPTQASRQVQQMALPEGVTRIQTTIPIQSQPRQQVQQQPQISMSSVQQMALPGVFTKIQTIPAQTPVQAQSTMGPPPQTLAQMKNGVNAQQQPNTRSGGRRKK